MGICKHARLRRRVSPVAPLRQTLQDVIAEAELVIPLTAVDALQGDGHQLIRVPNDLLLALERRRGEVSVCAGCIFSNGHGDMSLPVPLWGHKYNIYSTGRQHRP